MPLRKVKTPNCSFALGVQGDIGGEHHVINGRVDFAEILLIQIGKKHHLANTAITAVRGAFPGRFNLDGDHENNLAY